MDSIIVRFLKLFSPLFARQGVDTDRLFAIVEIKLKMDKRRPYLQAGNKWNGKKDENKNRFAIVLLVYSLFSILIAMMIYSISSLLLSMIFFHSYLLFMMAMTLITDFSNVMLDTTDNQVILHRPINSKTLFAARMVHVFAYLTQFAMAMVMLPLISIFITYGVPVGLGAIVTSVSTILLSTFLTWILYMIVLRFSSEQKLKDVITYFQIFMTFLFVAGYQIIPRLINFSAISQDFSLGFYSYFAPPVWMAKVLEAIDETQYDSLHILMIFLAIGLPPVLFWITNKYLAPSFSQKISMINSDSGTVENISAVKGRTFTISEKISSLFCKNNAEQAAFQLTWKITSRDKMFRLQFYPSIGYLFVFIIIFVFRTGKSANEIWENLGESNNFLWGIYMPLFMIQTAAALLAYNENYRAAWVYFSSPVKTPGALVAGSVKAIFVKYCIPVFLGFFIFSLVIWGVRIIDDFLLGFFTLLACLFFSVVIADKNLPFSQQPNTLQQSGRWIKSILQMLVVGLMIGLHYLTILFPLLMFIFIPLMIVAAWLMITKVQQIYWNQFYALD